MVIPIAFCKLPGALQAGAGPLLGHAIAWKVHTNVGLTKIVEGAYLVPLGMANSMLLDSGHDFALVDREITASHDEHESRAGECTCRVELAALIRHVDYFEWFFTRKPR